MNAVAVALKPHVAHSPLELLAELRRRQPHLAAMAEIFLMVAVPCLLAMQLDARTVNDISVWVKPTKFALSIALYFATLGWCFGYLPRQAQQSRAGRFVIWAAILPGSYELLWLMLAASFGVPSHFNLSQPVWNVAYPLAGMGATVMLCAMLVQGVLLANDRHVVVAPAFRLSLILAAVIAFIATTLTAGFLSQHAGHWVGGVPSDLNGLPLLGWSRSGGDLRVPHFWALHVQQILPLAGMVIARSGTRHARALVAILALAYCGFVAFTFMQALSGRPFLA
jgi:hypothetical protein